MGDLVSARHLASGQSSSSDGYMSGGSGPPASTRIDKFPFSSDANSAEVGFLTAGRQSLAGQSSTTNGYVSGGAQPAVVNTIENFPYAISSGFASDVGDLTLSRYGGAGQQV